MPFKDKEKARAYAKEYAQKNRSRINANAQNPARKEKRKLYLEEYFLDPEKKEMDVLRKRKYYEDNKEDLANKARLCREENKKLILDVQLHFLCMNPNCPWQGPYDPSILEFHHVDPKNKRAAVKTMTQYPTSSIAEEINKCVLLCCNCHRLAHKGKVAITRLCVVDQNLIPIGDCDGRESLEGSL